MARTRPARIVILGGGFAGVFAARELERRLAREREQLNVIDDQIGAPTGADLLADVTAHAIRHILPPVGHNFLTQSGIYHLAAAGQTSWHGYACLVLETARAAGVALKVAPESVKAIPTTAYPTPARRPLNSRLDTNLFETTFGLRLPPWQQGVLRMLAETSGT